MKATVLVDTVKKYVSEHNVSARAACEKLGFNQRNYYAAVQRLKKGKEMRASTAAAKRRVVVKDKIVAAPVQAPAVAPFQVQVAAPSSGRAFLVVGDASSIAEIARSLQSA